MKRTIQIYYDEEGDFLEIDIDDNSDVIFKNLGKGIFEKVDKKTGELRGVAIHNFIKRTENLKTITISPKLSIH